MTDIIRFAYGCEYAVSRVFDLNILKELESVKEVGGKYVFDQESNGITVEINRRIVDQEEDVYTLKIKDVEQKAEQYRRWWEDEQKCKEAIQRKLEAISQQVGEAAGKKKEEFK